MQPEKNQKNTEDTPFVIEFKQKSTGYGTAPSTSTSGNVVNSSNNNNTPVRTPPKLYCLHGISNIEVRDHCHRQRSEGVDVKARKKLIIASVLCLFFMICEIIGGFLSNSLAIATDAAHLLTDFASFMISLFAIWIAGRPSTQRMSFGWYRAEVIGALASVVMIWVITAILVWLAIQRLINKTYEVEAEYMLITSAIAVLFNIIMGFQLHHGHSHGGGGGGHSHGGSHSKKESGKDVERNDVCELKAAKRNGFETPRNSNTVSRTSLTDSTKASNLSICPESPKGRIEDGVADLEADAQLPGDGLRTFSYQNSKSVGEVHSEIAAVMAETAPGAHHHGGEAAREAVNLNVRAAFIHVVGDMVQSVGVFIAALLIYFRPDWAIADPICTFIFSIIVLFTTFAIMKDALLVLMEGTPSYLHYTEVLNIFQQIEGVERVHNLRIWALSINKIALSAHLAIASDADPKTILQTATTAVHMRYNFFETTIQIEDFTPDMENCKQCSVPDK
ncbi:zinc transporter 2 [Teleopsis dalmanni]|uniref:zinc transporter 2 n=1 Tax=Teleopsis dalmanni TaxID=139649 RepID=UPI0018CF93E6|nr:zinc transporter 2 [Teleopsis dalmanni]